MGSNSLPCRPGGLVRDAFLLMVPVSLVAMASCRAGSPLRVLVPKLVDRGVEAAQPAASVATQAVTASSGGAGTLSAGEEAIGGTAAAGSCTGGGALDGLARTLVLVMKDSYGQTGLAKVTREVSAIERTWARSAPHLTYILLNRSSADKKRRTTAVSFLSQSGVVQADTTGSNHSYVHIGAQGFKDQQSLAWKTKFEEFQATPNIDWVLEVNLQTYVVAPNLCVFLSRISRLSSTPALVGRPLLIKGEKYPSAFGSCGFLISREGLESFERVTHNFAFDRFRGKAHSTLMAEAGLFVRDSRDEKGRERFHVFSVVGELYPHPQPWAQTHCCWFNDYSFYGHQQGMECCAATTISFHYVDPPEQLALHYALERAADLRRSRRADTDIAAEVFGPGWTGDPSINQYGHSWRDPALVGPGARVNNSLARELLANQIRLGAASVAWDVSRTLSDPPWSHVPWLHLFRNSSGFV